MIDPESSTIVKAPCAADTLYEAALDTERSTVCIRCRSESNTMTEVGIEDGILSFYAGYCVLFKDWAGMTATFAEQ